MIQDYVDLIYDYLHEYYRYENGELIVIKTKQGSCSIGSTIGSFGYKRNAGSPILTCSITINGKRSQMQLKHLIYIFHHKEKPKNIYHLDANAMNCRIENLIATKSLNKFIQQKENYREFSGASRYTYKGKTRFRVRFSTEKEGRFTIGSYDNEEIASKAYALAKKLYSCESISKKHILEKIKKKFPPNRHKKSEFINT